MSPVVATDVKGINILPSIVSVDVVPVAASGTRGQPRVACHHLRHRGHRAESDVLFGDVTVTVETPELSEAKARVQGEGHRRHFRKAANARTTSGFAGGTRPSSLHSEFALATT